MEYPWEENTKQREHSQSCAQVQFAERRKRLAEAFAQL